jgi:hypothetical protein
VTAVPSNLIPGEKGHVSNGTNLTETFGDQVSKLIRPSNTACLL